MFSDSDEYTRMHTNMHRMHHVYHRMCPYAPECSQDEEEDEEENHDSEIDSIILVKVGSSVMDVKDNLYEEDKKVCTRMPLYGLHMPLHIDRMHSYA